ncbi:MAG: radical SAM protein [Deltaproteobacteria bacterium]|nr:radical SAM protein [Deltaproteobacteria bacterium]
MIKYEEPIYRPPSEARSLILQATIGCSTNSCAFCVAYQGKRFRARREEELFPEIEWAAKELPGVRRVFLADGDALVLSTNRLSRILERLYERLENLERVTVYGSPQNLKKKSVDDLKKLREAGLTMIYYGIESGDDEVLEHAVKRATAQELIDSGVKPQQAGIDLSATVILGLGGPRLSTRHAQETARVINAIAPRYTSALTLMLAPRKPTFEEVYDDPTWRLLSSEEALAECRILIDEITAGGITFRSNHASNYLALAGDLQKDKPRLLKEIDDALGDPESRRLRPEYMRGL